ncbi:ATP/GTP-binding protein [Acinetobacter sp. B51(2017)]|uniref:GTP-binding protein n=1 Tax=Acinetobacter sp. B51(2017) TaxID=2060938 RepID=UPI000F07E970|nr:ATP/GTP-binding protein [Acinetobacter sp. B51(2017)]
MILQQYKIVFAGAMGAGKSAAIKTISQIDVLSTEALNTDVAAHQKNLTTVGIDYGEIVLEDDIKVGLYGTPGQERFNFMWGVICKGALGTILLIDHSIDDPISALEEYLATFQEMSNNIIIGITHVDEKTTQTTSIYRDWQQKQSHNYPLFFVDARVKEDVLLMVDALIANAEVNFAH